MKIPIRNFLILVKRFKFFTLLNVLGLGVAFACRTPLHGWVFALSLAVVLLITLSTVTFQSWRVATANPIGALRSE